MADPGTQGKMDGLEINWAFGDGLTAKGVAVEHVYVKTGDYRITMTANGSGGRRIEQRWQLHVVAIEHLDGPYKEQAEII